MQAQRVENDGYKRTARGWHAYAIVPIDGYWDALKSVKETLVELADDTLFSGESDWPNAPGDTHLSCAESFLANWKHAKEEALALGWEGIFDTTPRVFWVPDENEFAYGFVFRQPNNGTTFVVSPVPLPWLMEILV